MSSITQELVCSDKIKIRLKILIKRLIRINLLKKCSSTSYPERLKIKNIGFCHSPVDIRASAWSGVSGSEREN